MTREQFISHVELNQKALRRFLTALCCGDAHSADDIAQETYIKAYLSSDGFDSPDKFKAWIFRIGYNTFLNHKRSERMFTGYDAARDTPAPDTPEAAFRYQALYAALDHLPAKERTSVLLYYMEGYAIKEVADIVDATPEAVRQHLSRGRAHLRGLLQQPANDGR